MCEMKVLIRLLLDRKLTRLKLYGMKGALATLFFFKYLDVILDEIWLFLSWFIVGCQLFCLESSAFSSKGEIQIVVEHLFLCVFSLMLLQFLSLVVYAFTFCFLLYLSYLNSPLFNSSQGGDPSKERNYFLEVTLNCTLKHLVVWGINSK